MLRATLVVVMPCFRRVEWLKVFLGAEIDVSAAKQHEVRAACVTVPES